MNLHVYCERPHWRPITTIRTKIIKQLRPETKRAPPRKGFRGGSLSRTTWNCPKFERDQQRYCPFCIFEARAGLISVGSGRRRRTRFHLWPYLINETDIPIRRWVSVFAYKYNNGSPRLRLVRPRSLLRTRSGEKPFLIFGHVPLPGSQMWTGWSW